MLPKGNIKEWRTWLQIIRRRWFILLISLIFATGIGLIKALTTTPEYESSAKVTVLRADLLAGSTLRFVPRVPHNEEIQFLRQIVTSNEFLLKLVDSSDVKNDPKVYMRIKRLCAENPQVECSEIAAKVYVEFLKEKISLRITSNNLIQIKVTGNTANQAYTLCQLVTNLAIKEAQNFQQQTANVASSFSHELLNKYKRRLVEAEERLNAFNSGLIKEATNNDRLEPEKLEEIKSIQLSTEFEIKTKRNKIRELYASVGWYTLGYDTTLQNLKNQIIKKTEDVCRLFQYLSWRENEIIRLNEQINQLRQNAYDHINSTISKKYSYRSAVDVKNIGEIEKISFDISILKHTVEMYKKIIKAHNESVHGQPSQEVVKARLEREVSINRQLYELLSQQLTGTQIRESAIRETEQMQFKMLIPPERPLERTKPQRSKILVVSFLLGGAIGIGIILGLESLNLSINSVEEARELLNVPVLATIPKMITAREIRERKLKRRLLIPMVLTLSLCSAFAAYLLVLN